MSFFFNDTATTEIYTLSLHDALPDLEVEIAHLLVLHHAGVVAAFALGRSGDVHPLELLRWRGSQAARAGLGRITGDWKSTRLKSRHAHISYDDFFFKKKIHICSECLF